MAARPLLPWLGIVLALFGAPALAHADQQPASGTGAPVKAAPAPPAIDLDLDQIVTSAAKGVTTVQEAPAIITIITAEEIKQRGYRDFGQVLSSIPGFIDARGEGDQLALPMVRGAVQAVLYLRDGVSMFEPTFNLAATNRSVPLETIKRIEVVTGPGGVLWGSNSYLGVVNVITKDAEDVKGVQAGVHYGDGPGNAQDFRVYAMFGRSFWKKRLKVMLHTSYENYLGEQFTDRPYIVASPTPQPIGPGVYGLGTVSSDPVRSWIFDVDGKVSLGPISLYFQVPFGELNFGSTFSSALIVKDKGPDGNVCPGCDRTQWNVLDRYAVLEYRDRFAGGKVGLDIKGYYVDFDRQLQLRVFPSSTVLPGGLTFRLESPLVHKYGGTFDLDYSGPWSWNRVLVGGELVRESASGNGPGGAIEATFLEPYSNNLGLLCPLDPSDPTRKQNAPGCTVPFLFGGAERVVVGLFVADQIRPWSRLTLDGGFRYQQGFGKLGYNPVILGSAAAVWQFLPGYHLKLNFTQGFRPPVFNNMLGNGAAVQFAGNTKLQTELSESYSAEVNARVLRGVGKVRELQLRLDYAYTLLDRIIVIRGGSYENSGRRAIHSVEFLAKLYLQGDHYLTLAYTFQRISTSDNGEFRSVPRHYFQLGAVFNIVRNLFDVNGNLTVFGGADDPNRYPYAPTILPGGQPALVARITDFTFDRLPPAVVLQLGARLRLAHDHLWLSAQFYNALNQVYYHPDIFYDLAPVVEVRPNQAPSWSALGSVTFKF